MPPRSTRAAPAADEVADSAPKRRASARVAGASSAALKKQKYDSGTPDKSAKSTATESKYFQKNKAKKPKRKSRSSSEEEEDDDEDFISENDGDEDLSEAESDFWRPEAAESAGKEAITQAVKGFAKKRGAKSEASRSSEDNELWREGVKTGLGPGKEVFIAKPKARDPGDVPYNDDTLHPNTMLFLEDLTKNNDRQWLKGTVEYS